MGKITYNQLRGFAQTLKNVDWKLLYEQREGLTSVISMHRDSPWEDDIVTIDDLGGILNLLDALSDDAENAGLFVHPNPTEN